MTFPLATYPFRHSACAACYPIFDGPHETFTAICGVAVTTPGDMEAPECPDCLAIREVIRRCARCGANIYFHYDEETA